MRLERYGAVTVLPVMAAPAEYGEHLRARIDPLMTGIGPVEGAVALTAALARLEANLERLPETVRSRLVLENDDRIYTPADLLPLCARTGLPFVYDVHHHRCHPDGQSIEAVTEQALATWLREPLFHLSSPRDGWQGANPRPHHDYIDPGDLPACWVGRQLTVEVEAKAKELALQRLIAAQAPRAATP